MIPPIDRARAQDAALRWLPACQRSVGGCVALDDRDERFPAAVAGRRRLDLPHFVIDHPREAGRPIRPASGFTGFAAVPPGLVRSRIGTASQRTLRTDRVVLR